MRDGTLFIGLCAVAITFVISLGWGLDIQRTRLFKYEDTIAEYVMCIEYNPDCECSDIILSKYGEEEKK